MICHNLPAGFQESWFIVTDLFSSEEPQLSFDETPESTVNMIISINNTFDFYVSLTNCGNILLKNVAVFHYPKKLSKPFQY